MLEKVLVPLDGSELSHGILVFVRRLAAGGASEVELVRVVTSEDTLELTATEARDLARAHLARVAGVLARQGVTARTAVRQGDAASEILALARSERASLIALATHGRTGLARFALGSVAERLLRASPVPLFLANTAGVASLPWWGAPEGSEDLEREIGFRRILVPLDGSEDADSVLPAVCEIARLHGSEVTILHVSRAGEAPPFVSAHALLAGVPHQVKLVDGRPAPAILDVANEGLYDLVAMATHGTGGASPWPFGATAEHVLRACAAPLLVQPSGSRGRGRGKLHAASATGHSARR
jgi:nucleotide-binding universal stress UspA family protein